MIDNDLVRKVAQQYVEGRFKFPTPEFWMHLEIRSDHAEVGKKIRLGWGGGDLKLRITKEMSESPSCHGWAILNHHDEIVWGYPLLSQERPEETPFEAFQRWHQDSPEYSQELRAARAVLMTTCVLEGSFQEVQQWLSKQADKGDPHATEVVEGERALERLSGYNLERFWHFPHGLFQKKIRGLVP